MIRNNDLNNWKARAPANRVGLLLAGGDGTRLQELTKTLMGTPTPKQYCRLIGNSSLLQSTLSRIHLFAPWRRISAIINRNHLEIARKQLGSLNESNIYIQPKNLDTGPGIVFALLRLVESYPDSIVIVPLPIITLMTAMHLSPILFGPLTLFHLCRIRSQYWELFPTVPIPTMDIFYRINP